MAGWEGGREGRAVRSSGGFGASGFDPGEIHVDDCGEYVVAHPGSGCLGVSALDGLQD
jgi:hypothetical protein